MYFRLRDILYGVTIYGDILDSIAFTFSHTHTRITMPIITIRRTQQQFYRIVQFSVFTIVIHKYVYDGYVEI